MSTYRITYWKNNSVFLGDYGRIKVDVKAPSEEAAVKCAQRFCLNPKDYTWTSKVKE